MLQYQRKFGRQSWEFPLWLFMGFVETTTKASLTAECLPNFLWYCSIFKSHGQLPENNAAKQANKRQKHDFDCPYIDCWLPRTILPMTCNPLNCSVFTKTLCSTYIVKVRYESSFGKNINIEISNFSSLLFFTFSKLLCNPQNCSVFIKSFCISILQKVSKSILEKCLHKISNIIVFYFLFLFQSLL